MSNIVEAIVPSGYVGFDSITRQIEQRLVRRGFQFNLMVVGSSGLGKTTLINSLFASHLVDSHGRKDVTEPIKRTSEISVTSRELQEKNVRLKLNLIDTPGFGDQVNNDRCWEPIVRYIKDQYSHYLRRELTPQRERFIPDTRVHCVLYFIRPHSLGLQELDVVVLKHLTEIVNVVPVIAKSDTLTLEERAEFKRVVQAQLAEYNLTIYPYDAEGLLEEERLQNAEIRRALPFAVVGSENSITIDGKTVRGFDRNDCFDSLRIVPQ